MFILLVAIRFFLKMYEFEQSTGRGKKTQWTQPIAHSIDPSVEAKPWSGTRGRADHVLDPFPGIVTAGVLPGERDTNAVRDSLRHPEPASTPDDQRQWRNSVRKQPGVMFISAGQTSPASSTTRFGVKTVLGERASDTFREAHLPENNTQAVLLAHTESVYLSKRMEPLGRSFTRYRLPDFTQTSEFKFGAPVINSEPAQKLIWSQSAANEEEAKREMELDGNSFRKEQPITKKLNRNYDWNAIHVNPVEHRFGKFVPVEENGVAKSLKQISDETKLMSLQIEQLKNVTHQPLGRVRNKRGNVAHLPDNFVFGKKNFEDEWNVQKLLTGAYTLDEQQPDYNLGVSFRKLTSAAGIPQDDGTRVYGCPTILVDAVAPPVRSLGDLRNFGDEVDAKGLLFPSKYATQGLREVDFLKQRTEEDIREIFKRAAGNLTEDEFVALCDAARKNFGQLSVDSFRRVLNPRFLQS